MGSKGSHQHSGARGRDGVKGLTVIDTESAVAELTEALYDEVQHEAAKHGVKAVQKINHLMRSAKTPRSIQRQAAMNLIEIAHGRVGQRPADVASGPGGITINILQLSEKDKGPLERLLQPERADEEEIPLDLEEAEIAEPSVAPAEQNEITIEPAWAPKED